MVVGVLRLELFLPEPNSLKSKRQILNALIQKMESNFKRISLAEVDGHDLWQKTVLGISIVGKDQKFVDSKINDIISFVQRDGRLEIIKAEVDFITY